MKIIFDYNRTLFNPETNSLYFGVQNLLEVLSQKHELFLITRNEPSRIGRLKEFGIEKFFQKMLFVYEKNEEIFLDLVGSSKNVLVVGDSIDDEIRIGNKLRFTTVLITQEKYTNHKMNSEEKPTHIINEICHLEKLI